MSAKTIGDVLRATAARLPDKTAVIAGGERLTYAQLDRAADRFAQALLAHDLGPGHTVAILAPNIARYGVFYFGAARAGGMQAHLSVRYTADDLKEVIARTGIEAVFADAEFLPALMEARQDLPGLRSVVCFDGAQGDDVPSLDDWLGDAPESAPKVEIDPAQPFCMTYTGGTTGFPKAVLASHAARVLSSEVAWATFQIDEEDVIFLASPMFHVAGLFSWFTTGVLGGVTMIFMRGWDPAKFIEISGRENVTCACMVPTQINGFVHDPSFAPDKMPRLRYINYGGSPMPESQLRRMYELFPGIVMFEHYGQSEVGPACYRPPEMALKKPTSIGRPFGQLTLEFRDRDDAPVPQGEVGELTLQCDWIFSGYLNDPEQTARALTDDGWLRTGDLGYIDKDGYVYLVDRSKDMIISGGENIYPAEIENAIYEHDAVAEAAVFGIPDDHWGELPAAHVVLKPGKSLTQQELEDFVAGKVARHKRPRLVRFVDELPKTAIGKIRKNILRAPYWEGRERAI